MTDDSRNAALPNVQGKRPASQVDIQKSKTIQSEQWEMIARVKQSLESNAFNSFFASSLANLPNYRNPQELAKALADQFLQKEMQRKGKRSQNESLPNINTPALTTSERKKIISKKYEKQKLNDSIISQPKEIFKQSPKKRKSINESNDSIVQEKQFQPRTKKSESIFGYEPKHKESMHATSVPRRVRELEKLSIKKVEIQQQSPKRIQIRIPNKINSNQQISYKKDDSPLKSEKLKDPLPIKLTTLRCFDLQPLQPQYIYHLGKGNNHELIIRIMETRPYWRQTSNTSRANFRWAQGNKKYKYSNLKHHKHHKELLNHFEFHHEITNKQNLLQNLAILCENLKLQLFDMVPVTFAFDFMNQDVEGNIFTFLHFFNKNAPTQKQLSEQEVLLKLAEIKKKLRLPPVKEKRIVDYTMRSTFLGEDYLWLLKPTGLNRGRGIHVWNNLDEMVNLLIDYQQGIHDKEMIEYKDEEGTVQTKQMPVVLKSSSFVVQKYIEKPLLIRNRKFDIRVWVLVDFELNCYFFQEGYIRTASEEYTTQNCENQYIHLTNNAIQKFSEKYGELDDGNQMSFDAVSKYFCDKLNFEDIIQQMKVKSYLAMNSISSKLDQNRRKFCFEVFGLDYMIDADLNLYLIEVNTNPCIEESSPLLAMLIPRMLDDALQLTLDQIFPIQRSKESPFPVSKYDNEENMWYFNKLTQVTFRVIKRPSIELTFDIDFIQYILVQHVIKFNF